MPQTANKQIKITIGKSTISSRPLTEDQVEQLLSDLRTISLKENWFNLPPYFQYPNVFLRSLIYIPSMSFIRVHELEPGQEVRQRGRTRKLNNTESLTTERPNE